LVEPKPEKPATISKRGAKAAKAQSETTESNTTMATATETTEAPKKNIVKGERLVGDELLRLVQELGDSVEEDEFVRRAGYYSQTLDENGEVVSERLQTNAFYVALTAAQGIKIKAPSRSGGGRKQSDNVKVAKTTKKIAIPGHAADRAGFNEGDKVKFDVSEGQIVITLLARADQMAESQIDDEDMDGDEDEDF
jgi:antitoxin component of MazEF toxin-antitoxin module